MDLFNLVASLSLNTDEYDKKVKEAENPDITIKDPKLGLDKTEYDHNISEAGSEAETFSTQAEGAFSAVEKALTAAGIATAVKKIADAFSSAIQYAGQLGDDIGKGARYLQISTRSYQQLDYALKFNNGSVSDLRKGISHLNDIIRDGDDATGEAADAFRSLGISMTNSEGQMKTVDELMTDTLIALAGIGDADQQAMLVKALFGPNSSSIINLLAAGTEGVKDMLGAAERDNMILSDEEIANAEKYQDSVTRLEESLQHLQSDFADNILPILTVAIDAITEIINFFRGNGMGGGLFAGGTILSGLVAGKALKWGGGKLLSLMGMGGGSAAAGGSAGIGTTLKGLLTGEGGLASSILHGLPTVLAEAAPIFATQAGVMLIGLLPSILAQNMLNDEWRKKQTERKAAADLLEAQGYTEEAEFIRAAADAEGLVLNDDGTEAKNVFGQSYTQYTDDTEALLRDLNKNPQLRGAVVRGLRGKSVAGNYGDQLLLRYLSGEVFSPDVMSELLNAAVDGLREELERNPTLSEDLSGISSATQDRLAFMNGLWASGMRNTYIPGQGRRELPAGYEWSGTSIFRVDENGNHVGGGIDTKYWDEASWEKWINGVNGTKVEVDPEITDEGLAGLQTDLDNGNLTVPVEPRWYEKAGGWFGHSKGAWDIPYDDYPALLHRDEMVLSASQARRYRDGEMNADYGIIGEMIGAAIEGAMGRVMVMMSGEKVGDLTTKRVKNNINASSFSRVRALGG